MQKRNENYNQYLNNELLVNREIFNQDRNTPNSAETMAEAASSIANNLGSKNMFSNVASGFAAGAKMAGANQRRKAFEEKMLPALEQLRAMNSEIRKRNMALDKDAEATNVLLPQLQGFISNAKSMTPEMRDKMMGDLLSQYKDLTGNNVRFRGFIGNNFMSPVVEVNDKDVKIMNIPTLFAGVEEAQKDIANAMPHALIEQEMKQKQLEINQQNANDRGMTHDLNYIYNKGFANKSGVVQATELPKLQKNIKAGKKLIRTYGKMLDIAENHPDLFQSNIAAIWRQEDETVFNDKLKSLSELWNPEKVKAVSKLNKYISDAKISGIKSLDMARLNEFIERLNSKAFPSTANSAQAFMELVEENMEEADIELGDNLALRSQYTRGSGGQYWNGEERVRNQSPNQPTKNTNVPEQQQNTITLKSPTGQVVKTANDQSVIVEAKKQGWVVVNE